MAAEAWREDSRQLRGNAVYDINQLGGNIQNGDVARYKHRIADWKAMLDQFPGMQKFTLAINYRNAREIAEHYLGTLSQALPTKPSADVPVFEAGEVVQQQIKRADLNDVLASTLRRLLHDYAPRNIGIVILSQGPEGPRRSLAERRLPVSGNPSDNAIAVTTASKIRGYERQVMIVATTGVDALRRNFGVAIDAYIAMSRAIKRLFIVEIASS